MLSRHHYPPTDTFHHNLIQIKTFFKIVFFYGDLMMCANQRPLMNLNSSDTSRLRLFFIVIKQLIRILVNGTLYIAVIVTTYSSICSRSKGIYCRQGILKGEVSLYR